jgi:hypothetical protein
MSSPALHLLAAGLLVLLVPHAVDASESGDGKTTHARCTGAVSAGDRTPSPADPYPLMAAGWGPELGGGRLASRWAEDWSGMQARGRAPALKAMPLGHTARLTLGAEFRLRQATWDNARLVRENDLQQTQLRAVFGADLRLDPHFRFYGELGTGRVAEGRNAAAPNFQNDVSLQQLFMDARGNVGDALVGVMAGRQEFSDGPRQIMSLSDGPNLHRSWNGLRLYVHGARYRFGAFDLRATKLGRGGFDEGVNVAEKLQGVTTSFIVSPGEGPNTYLDPFWLRTAQPAMRIGDRAGAGAGADERDTVGVRLWGRRGNARFDWTFARQTGRTIDHRRVDAWALFAVQSLALSESGWKPRLTSRIDVASGGGAYGGGQVRDFNPLLASSNYAGEGQFLGLSNVLILAPGITFSPTPRTTLSFEYGLARRLQQSDAVYAASMRAYAGTQGVPGRDIGGLARVSGSWSATQNLTLSVDFEHLSAGDVLARAGYPSGSHAYLSATYRY